MYVLAKPSTEKRDINLQNNIADLIFMLQDGF